MMQQRILGWAVVAVLAVGLSAAPSFAEEVTLGFSSL
jgi:hypothetical protein